MTMSNFCSRLSKMFGNIPVFLLHLSENTKFLLESQAGNESGNDAGIGIDLDGTTSGDGKVFTRASD